jgi:hypothetical protein
MIPDLGYKKDAFLKPSLVSNLSSDTHRYHQTNNLSLTMSSDQARFDSEAERLQRASVVAAADKRTKFEGRLINQTKFENARGRSITAVKGKRPDRRSNGGVYPEPQVVGPSQRVS